MRRPVVYAALVLVLLVLSGYYLFGVEFGNSDILDYLIKYETAKISQNSADPSFDAVIGGKVESVKEKEVEYHQLVINVNEVEGKDISDEDILLNLYGKLPDGMLYSNLAGRTVNVKAELTLPSERRNPGCFDYRLYLKTKKIYLAGTAETSSFEVTDGKYDRITNYLSNLRAEFVETVRKNSNEETAALISAMLFGDKSQLDDDVYEMFQKNGIAHVLAVSGLHIGIIYAFISFLWRGRKRGAFSVSVTVFLLFYACLADFSPSVMRAVIMIILHMISKLLHRRYDLLSAAAATCILMLLNNPMQLFNIGFQLSFGAIAMLSVLIPLMKEGIKGKLILMASFQFAMVPFTAYCFNYFSIISFLVNFPVVLIADILIPAGVSVLVVSSFATSIAGMGSSMIAYLSDLLITINEITYKPGYTNFEVASPPVWMIVVFYGVFFLVLNENIRIRFLRKQYFRIALSFTIAVSIGIISTAVTDEGFGNCNAVFLDVGQGDCLLLKDIDGKNYLFDGGGKETFFENQKPYDVGKKILKPALLKNGVTKIDAAFVTHLHADHYDGIRSLARQGFVKRLCVYEANSAIQEKITKETGLEPSKITYAHKGNTYQLGNDTSVEVLWPEHMTRDKYESAVSEDADENSISMVMRISIEGVSILITGDIDQNCEEKLVSAYGNRLNSDILKVAHHGSKYSSSDSFINAVNPRWAIIQVGKNTFGHPTSEVLEKLKERRITMYRTDLDCAVGLELKDGVIKIIRKINNSD